MSKQTQAAKHLAAFLSMAPAQFSVAEDWFVMQEKPDGTKVRYINKLAPAAQQHPMYVAHEVAGGQTLPSGILLNPFSATAGVEQPADAAFYELMKTQLRVTLSTLLVTVANALSDSTDNPGVAKYLKVIDDASIKGFADMLKSLVGTTTWISRYYNRQQQKGVIKIVPLGPVDDQLYVKLVKSKKHRQALTALLNEFFTDKGVNGEFVGIPDKTLSTTPMSMSAQLEAFLGVYRSFLDNMHEFMYAFSGGDMEVMQTVPATDAYEEAMQCLDEDARAIRFRSSCMPMASTANTPVAAVLPGMAAAPTQPQQPVAAQPYQTGMPIPGMPIPNTAGNPLRSMQEIAQQQQAAALAASWYNGQSLCAQQVQQPQQNAWGTPMYPGTNSRMGGW